MPWQHFKSSADRAKHQRYPFLPSSDNRHFFVRMTAIGVMTSHVKAA